MNYLNNIIYIVRIIAVVYMDLIIESIINILNKKRQIIILNEYLQKNFTDIVFEKEQKYNLLA